MYASLRNVTLPKTSLRRKSLTSPRERHFAKKEIVWWAGKKIEKEILESIFLGEVTLFGEITHWRNDAFLAKHAFSAPEKEWSLWPNNRNLKGVSFWLFNSGLAASQLRGLEKNFTQWWYSRSQPSEQS